MSDDSEILMPVDDATAMDLISIHAVRQLSDAITMQGRQVLAHMEASTKAMERLSGRIDGMNERLVRLEEQKHGREIEKVAREVTALAKKVDDLEATRDQQKGAKVFVDWVRQTAPWLIAVIAGAVAVFNVNLPGK